MRVSGQSFFRRSGITRLERRGRDGERTEARDSWVNMLSEGDKRRIVVFREGRGRDGLARRSDEPVWRYGGEEDGLRVL